MFENVLMNRSNVLDRSQTNGFVCDDLFTCERGDMWNVREECVYEESRKMKGASFFSRAGVVCEVILVFSLTLNAQRALWSEGQEVHDTFIV